MKAFELRNSIIKLLDDNSESRYTVVNPQRRKTEAESIFDKPQVSVYYASGSFDKSKSSVNSPYHHDVTFNIWIQVAAKTRINIKVLQDPNATEKDFTEALNSSANASLEADEKSDEMLGIIFDLIMRPSNRTLGTDTIVDRFITSIQKNNPSPQGAIITMVSGITLTAQCSEEVTGETGIENGSVSTNVNTFRL